MARKSTASEEDVVEPPPTVSVAQAVPLANARAAPTTQQLNGMSPTAQTSGLTNPTQSKDEVQQSKFDATKGAQTAPNEDPSISGVLAALMAANSVKLLATFQRNECEFQHLYTQATDLNESTSAFVSSTCFDHQFSQFKAIGNTLQEILRKCDQSVHDHQAYESNEKQFLEWISLVEDKCKLFRYNLLRGSREELLADQSSIHDLQEQVNSAGMLVISASEMAERCKATTSMIGCEKLQDKQLDSLNRFQIVKHEIADISQLIEDKLRTWSLFLDSVDCFQIWINSIEPILEEIELKCTLDEKKGTLLFYQDLLVDIKNHESDLDSLENYPINIGQNLKEVDKIGIISLRKTFNACLTKCVSYLEKYLCYVNDHQSYSKAVMDIQDFIEATHNTVYLCGDLNLDRLSLQSNLNRLMILQSSLIQEYARVDAVRALGEKVIPSTSKEGEKNIVSQIESTHSDWENLVTTITSVISTIEAQLGQWNEYDLYRNQCFEWMKNVDELLSAVRLQTSFIEKKKQYEELKDLQGEVLAKELEIDNISEKGQQLTKNTLSVRDSSLSELVSKYQRISAKIKEEVIFWEQAVHVHREFENSAKQTLHWIENFKSKLDFCSALSQNSKEELENKLNVARGLILIKDDGPVKIQRLVEKAQEVLANTLPIGHNDVNETIASMQSNWAAAAVKIIEVKSHLEGLKTEWNEFWKKIEVVEAMQNSFEVAIQEHQQFDSTYLEKRSRFEEIKALEEKIRVEKIEVDTIRDKAATLSAHSVQSKPDIDAEKIFENFDELTIKIRKLLTEKEAQYRDHRLYQEAYDEFDAWIVRAREKFQQVTNTNFNAQSPIENSLKVIDSLLNKKSQGELLMERLSQRGKVVIANTSEQGQQNIQKETESIGECYENFYQEIAAQKSLMQNLLQKWHKTKEKYDGLLDWLQQIDILVKNCKLNLAPNLYEKRKQVEQIQDLISQLEAKKCNFDEVNAEASNFLSSQLKDYTESQLKQLNSLYSTQLKAAYDVLQKVDINYKEHEQYELLLREALDWISNFREMTSSYTETSSTATRQELLQRLNRLQDLMSKREDLQTLIHTITNIRDKISRNTRSDGKNIIHTQTKDLENEWERLTKKVMIAKTLIEKNLLHIADYNSSCDQLQQWMADHEDKLNRAFKLNVSTVDQIQPSLISGLSKKKAHLMQTNSIVKDIESLGHVVQSVTSKGSNLNETVPNNDISEKYEILSRQAKFIYEKQKETIEDHQALLDAGNQFAQWLRKAKECLAKSSEPIGDKELLAGKTAQLKVLEQQASDGKDILDRVLLQGEIACKRAAPDDREIIEEEVAILQEEYYAYIETLNNAMKYLEIAIIKWTDFQDKYIEALRWLNEMETAVQSFAKLYTDLDGKKIALEQFQDHLQTLFDWQKELDCLNCKAQLLLETCCNARISQDITLLTSKYNALLIVAKETMRTLELQYQEHQQHHALYEESQSWIESTKEKLKTCSEMPNSLNEVNVKLNTIKSIQQGFEQGQNRVRYLLDLKEKVIINTATNGFSKVEEDTRSLQNDFDKLLEQISESKQSLLNRAELLEKLHKSYNLLLEWLEYVEENIPSNEVFSSDLGLKKLAIEKCRNMQREFKCKSEIAQFLSMKLQDEKSIDPKDFNYGLEKLAKVEIVISKTVTNLENQVSIYGIYWKAFNEARELIEKYQIIIKNYLAHHENEKNVEEKIEDLQQFQDNLNKAKQIILNVQTMSEEFFDSCKDGSEITIHEDVRQLKLDCDALKSLVNDKLVKLNGCVQQWEIFVNTYSDLKYKLEMQRQKFQSLSIKLEDISSAEQYRCMLKELSNDIFAEKQTIEDLTVEFANLIEENTYEKVHDMIFDVQSSYEKLFNLVEGTFLENGEV